MTDLYTIAPDGSRLRQLTEAPHLDFGETHWSPDGARFTSEVRRSDGYCAQRLHVFDAATLESAEVPCGVSCSGGAWTADGSRLLVFPHRNVGIIPNSLYSIAPDGSDERLLVAAAGGTKITSADASPDGRYIVYTLRTGTTAAGHISQVMMADADGLNQRWVTTGFGAEFSPDGTRILYTRNDPDVGGTTSFRPMVTDLAGRYHVPVAPAPGLAAEGVAWSPDGTQILILVRRVFDSHVLAVRAPQGDATAPGGGGGSIGCLLGYRIVLRGDLLGASWGSFEPVTGTAAIPADVPCASAPAPPPVVRQPSSGLRTSLKGRKRGELRVRVRIAKGARGRIVVKAKQRGRRLKRRGLAGRKSTRTYRFVVKRSGKATVSVRFVGRDGWASKQLKSRKVRVRAKRTRGR